MNQGKEQMFDNFLADLFSNNIDLKQMGVNLPLDKSLMMQSVKK